MAFQFSSYLMVRPERFELPAFWFVAKRSIQLSYGRLRDFPRNLIQINRDSGRVQSARTSGCRRRRGLRLRRNEGQFGLHVQPRLAYELGDSRRRQSRCVIFNPQGSCFAVKAQLPDPINVFGAGQRKDRGLSGRGRVLEQNFNCGHSLMIPSVRDWPEFGPNLRASPS